MTTLAADPRAGTGRARVVPALPRADVSDAALAEVTRRLAATAAEHDRTGAVPWAGLQVVHEAGLLTATVGAQWGGQALGLLDTVRVLTALGEGDPSVALISANTLATHTGQAAHPHWPEATYDAVLRASLDRPTLLNAVRAEPELGAPARGGLPATTARRTDDGWVLSGRKAYATGGRALAWHVVWVVTDEPDRAADDGPRVGHLLVPGDADGISWVETWDHLGLRASNTHDVVYDDVRLPLDAFVEIPRGADGVYRDPAAATGAAGLGHPALYVGVARAARAAFVRFAQERVPSALGRPIATTERIQAVAGEVDAQVVLAETLLQGALLRLAAGHDVTAELSLVKVQAGRAAIAAVQTAVAALGNPALSRHHSLERHLRDVLCVRIHPPQDDAALLAAGRRLLAG